MPEPTWYFIGPDKTGFNCTDCCAGFSYSGASCLPYACPTSPSKFRNYLCPNSEFPTPHHIYKWNGDPNSSVSISVNHITCPSSSTTCWSYTPTGGLNAAGRRGSNCSQSYVTSTYRCTGDFGTCPPFSCSEGCFPMGSIVYPEFCSVTASGCHCSSSSSYENCYCFCPDDGCEFGQGTKECIDEDGNSFPEVWCYGDPEPICPCYGTPPDCGSCSPECVDTGYYTCPPSTCSPACSAGFVCECGECVCNTSSTCCVGYSAGWYYNTAAPSRCEPCYEGYWSRSDCCYKLYKQKHCSNENDTCCNDGRCYSQSTVLCQIPTGNMPPP